MERLRLLAGVLVLFVASCVSGKHYYNGPWLHRSLFESGRTLPARVLLLPPHVVAGTSGEHFSCTADAEVSRRLADELVRHMGELLAARGCFEPVAAPALDDEQRPNLAAHSQLFAIVARAAQRAGNGGTTPSFKLREFDYTLGPGLAELGRRCGVEAALMIEVVVIGGLGTVVAGVVDLSSGDLLWLQRGGLYLRKEEPERKLLTTFEGLWQDYPGLKAFARVRGES
ncbi:MAG: hypothetical protein EXS08_15045 [Planctomycetes bacterium]|nr:hypothetical protein [Planctomycetota bacterium]